MSISCSNSSKNKSTEKPKEIGKVIAITTTTVEFPSLDSLLVTADFYFRGREFPMLILCHQAHYSRGEYKETAFKLCEKGFNCVAIDQRSGDEVNGIINETAKRAKEQNLPTEYLDAEQDIVAAIAYVSAFYNCKVILVGSSYSSSLALKIATENDLVEKVAAFSPGEYFADQLNLKAHISSLIKPVFITSSKKESGDAKLIFNAIPSANKIQYIPETEGEHGSKALWTDQADQEGYWDAFLNFLSE